MEFLTNLNHDGIINGETGPVHCINFGGAITDNHNWSGPGSEYILTHWPLEDFNEIQDKQF